MDDAPISFEELQLATRNHGMPLEGMRWPVTPIGLHYLLIHFDIPVIDAGAWRLEVSGRVEAPLSLSLAELQARPAAERTVTMECAGNGRGLLDPRPLSQPWLSEAVGTATWTGTPLAGLLDEAGLGDDVVDIVFTGLDRGLEDGVEQAYERSLAVDDALHPDVLLAYAVNGQPLPPQHGFPLRVVVPGWYGMTNVKWLGRISATAEAFRGFQQERRYRFRIRDDDPGAPVTRMRPRALMVPPGLPDFFTRRRTVELGPCTLEGRAWSGWAPIAAVEVSTDGGATWDAAGIEGPGQPGTWTGWAYDWHPPTAGEYELRCRARDTAGNRQPEASPWNVAGYANNAAHRVAVTVRA
ncbi:MAG: sulfite oxidase [Acidimicrobiales bacterium]